MKTESYSLELIHNTGGGKKEMLGQQRNLAKPVVFVVD